MTMNINSLTMALQIDVNIYSGTLLCTVFTAS